jgi:hypothetical protein
MTLQEENNSIFNLKQLLACLIFALISYFSLLNYAMRFEPAAGAVFERLPNKSGIFNYGRKSTTYLNGNIIRCNNFGYYRFGAQDCSFRENLTGKEVEATEVYLPSATTDEPIVVKISSEGRIYYQADDKEINEKWRNDTKNNCIAISLLLGVVLHIFIFLFLKFKKLILKK